MTRNNNAIESSMNEVSLAVALSLWIATLLILVIWVAFWKTKKKKTVHSDSEEEFLSEEISQNDDEPAFGTKLSSIQPIYKPYPIVYEHRGKEPEDGEEDENGYLYFSIKYEDHRSVLVVKLVKGENIPTQNLFPSKPCVEIQIIPARVEPGSGAEGIEFEIAEEELLRQTVHFCVCRYDRYSRKTTIGDVFLSLAELTAEGVNLSQEIFIKNLIEPNIEISITEPKSPQYLWDKIRSAIREGKLRPEMKRKSFMESVEWDAAEHAEARSSEEKEKTSHPGTTKSVKDNGPLGNLLFSLKYEAKRSTLLVRIMKAEGIPDHEGDAPNVLVECSLVPQESSEKPSATAVQEKAFTPVFEELFEYKIDFPELWKKKLHLVVWYVDAYFHLTSLGEVIYSLSQLNIEGFDISQTAMLFSKEITLLHQTKESPKKDSENDSSSILFSLNYLPATNRLGVFVLKAKDLKTTQDNQGVYVEVAIIHRNSRHKKMTGFKTSTQNPVYNETLLFDLQDFIISSVTLHVTIYEKTGMRADVPLGKVVLGKEVGGSEESHWLETLTAAKPIAQWHELQPYRVEKRMKNITTMRTRELRSFEFAKRRSQLFE